MSIIQQLEDLKEWSQDSTRYERRLAWRSQSGPGSMGTEAGTIPIEWDELSDREREYYRTGPWSTREDYRKGQLVQPGPGRQGYQGKRKRYKEGLGTLRGIKKGGSNLFKNIIKSPGARKFLKVAPWLLGYADFIIEGGMALPALARGNPQMARRSTTPGVFGSYGGTMLEDIRKYNRGAYRYVKAMKDVNEWNALQEDIERAKKVISGEIGGYPETAKTDLAEVKKKQALLEKNFREVKEADFQAFQDTMTQMAKDSREWSGDKNWLGQERGEQVTQESLEAEGVKPIAAHMMMQNADTTDEWRRKAQLEELDTEIAGSMFSSGLDVETFLDPYGLKVQDPRYSDLPTDIASDYGKWEADQARQKLEQLQNIDPGAAFAGGGIAGIRRPNAIPPESGPDPYGKSIPKMAGGGRIGFFKGAQADTRWSRIQTLCKKHLTWRRRRTGRFRLFSRRF
jgi:hypothetical protein